MSNRDQKHNMYTELLSKYKHLENYCKIEVRGLDDDNVYFHISFVINENVFITSQSDCANNREIGVYALNYNDTTSTIVNVGIYEDLLTPIIIGYHTNKAVVSLALTTLHQVKKHISQLDSYTTEYINNLLIGSSIKETTNHFISELNAVNKSVEFLQSQSLNKSVL